MARRSPPPPRCECGHVYGKHAGSCRFQSDPDDDETRCRCGGFRVPNSGQRTKHRVPKSKKKSTPWWR